MPTVGDADFGSVVLLLQGIGSDGSTTISDSSSSAHPDATCFGNARISTAQSKWGDSAIYLDGNGDYLTIPDSPDWAVGGVWTVEMWMYPTRGGTSQYFIGQGIGTGFYPFVMAQGGSDNLMGFVTDGASGNNVGGSGSGNLNINAWNHVALVMDVGGVLTIYANGSRLDTTTTGWSAVFDAAAPLCIGNFTADYAAGHPTNCWQGYIDDLRITKGVARYSGASYSVPATRFATAATTYLLSGTVTDSSGAAAARTVRIYRRDSGALIASTVSASDGTFSISTGYGGEVQAVCMDDVSGSTENDLITRTTPV